MVIVTETASDTDFEAGDLNVIDLATIEGISSIGASTSSMLTLNL